ncbi:MAG: secretin N-terminal domain-containing protein [Coraliomargarita sp.]
MKKHTIAYLMLATPFALCAQEQPPSIDEIDLSDVVIIEDAPVVEEAASGSVDTAVEVVEETATEAVEVTEVETAIDAPDPVEELVESAEDAVEPVVVEIPDMPIEGAEVVVDEPEIPTVTKELSSDTEVVLEMPGDITDPSGATMAEEETISVDFPDEDVRTVILNVAELFDLNVVVPDGLQGRTSIKLHNITWRDVYDVVLEPLGYAYVEDRNIIKIKSIEEIAAEPVTTDVIALQYARADDIIASVQPLVDSAAGGQIVSDTRKNLLVILERPTQLQRIRKLVNNLDKPTDQIMIETKFVEVFDQDIKNIGVNWASLDGYQVSAGPWQRDWTRERTSESTRDTSTTDDVSFTDQGLEFTQGTGFSDVASSVSGTSRLDTAVFNADQFQVVLSALESINDTELVSNPTVVVMNKREANFEVGQQYPIREITFNQETGTYEAGGLEKEFIGINLNVTPEVLGGNIHLSVLPKVSALAGTVESFGAQDPIIDERSVMTEVIIKDGYTLALGGLAERRKSDEDTKVPVLGDLPGVGRLFRSDSDSVGTRNLIVFITAKTLNPEGADYTEVIDPRMIDAMGIEDSDLPGYYFREGEDRMSDEERQLLERLEEIREETKRAAQIAELRAQIEALEGVENVRQSEQRTSSN